MNWANFTTLSRIGLIPLIIVAYYSSLDWANWLAAILFAVASITDWLDGYLARKLKQSSDFGAFLDPVADKILITVVLIMLVAVYPALCIAAIVIITRELLVSALREWMATSGQRGTVAVAFTGKLKTTVQMLAIIALLLAEESLPGYVLQTGYVLINIAALLSIWSMYHYFKNAWAVLFPKP